MAFKDNIGVQEELIVQLEDQSMSQVVDRRWLEGLLNDLIGLRNPMLPRERLETVIEKVQQAVDIHKHLFG